MTYELFRTAFPNGPTHITSLKSRASTVSSLGEALIAGALRDPTGAPPRGCVDVSHLLAAATRHRVLLLTGWMLRAAGRLMEWPAEFVDTFYRCERDAVAIDCLRHTELARVLGAMTSADLRVVLFKGAALAHTHYPAPHLRPRADADLLAAETEMPGVEQILLRLGYARQIETSGRLVSYQSHYVKIDDYGLTHAFDVHWKISNLQALADRITHEDVWERRVLLAAFGASACTAGDAHALLLALIHRAGHHPGSRNLLWIYDLHCLATGLSADQRREFFDLAAARGLSLIAAEGLALARDTFGTAGVEPLVEAFRAEIPRGQEVRVLEGSWTMARLLRLDLVALPGWRDRARLLREHLLPPPRYMRARYGVASNLMLPPLYLWRVLAGTPKWLRRQAADD
jgi:hypothetical protein